MTFAASESSSSIGKIGIGDWSKRQKAIFFESGLQRKASRIESSSSYTQSLVPLMITSLPSFVSACSSCVARSVTNRLFARTKAARLPSGENLANIRSPAPAESGVIFPVATSSTS